MRVQAIGQLEQWCVYVQRKTRNARLTKRRGGMGVLAQREFEVITTGEFWKLSGAGRTETDEIVIVT